MGPFLVRHIHGKPAHVLPSAASVLACLPTVLGAAPGEYFGIHVIDEPTGWNN
jgi:hypothetical protein